MPHNKVIEQLKENLQLAYRQSIDADAKLDALKKAGHGKFAAIFTKSQGFEEDYTRFCPYVAEIAADLQTLENQAELDAEILQDVVGKLALVLQTLQAFKSQSK
ncbi:prephenate dehydrogenase [Shewanella gelidii]|uniref:Prephenate dehydrogenase n=1 Tax=Shewanella gelidii TaxID=1642821 RepID=A0A917NBW3_9GAMM|nr:prephenate dehydrogenase [Shewanella gelidii]MCL1098820.1 prephenate dehydrogenase [Shewanella gelidii]GGI87432.1 hypothetical protein GCM10009332_25840 [Shewanella gelidii]